MSAGGEEEGQVYCIASVKREHERVGIAVASHPSDCLECAIITCNLIRAIHVQKRNPHPRIISWKENKTLIRTSHNINEST